MARAALPQRVAAVRRFNRFYTRQIGLLQETLLRSPFSLTEARVLYELGNRAPTHATALGQELGLDAGYLSRILRGFERRGLLERAPSKTDGRQSVLGLTGRGRTAFARLDGASRREIGTLLDRLPAPDQTRLDTIVVAAAGEARLRPHHREHLLRPFLSRAGRRGDLVPPRFE